MYYFIKQSPCTLIENILGIEPLKDKDSVLDYGSLGNFSLSGFEMVLTRYVSTYIITYYLPSGKKTNVHTKRGEVSQSLRRPLLGSFPGWLGGQTLITPIPWNFFNF